MMKKIYLLLCLVICSLGAWAQTSYTSTAAATAWNAARWNNAADIAPYTSTFTANNIASFTSGTYTFAGMGAAINVGNINVASGVTVNFASVGSTFATGGLVRIIDIGAGGLFDFNSQAISTAAGTGFVKNGAGVFATGGGNFTSGFVINAGTVIARGTTGLGSGGSNTLSLNGGTLAANASRAFANTRFPGGILFTGNFQLGEVPANVALASNTANLTFDNNVSLGGFTRTVTLGNAATNTFTGIISNTGGGLTIAANANGATGTVLLSGANTYSGVTTINGGILTTGAANTIPAATTMTLGGGTLRTGTGAGFTQSISTLNLAASSNIILGTGSHSLSFANSSAVSWTAAQTITITGWQGGYDGTAGTAGRIFVGTDATGLTAGQLAQITFRDVSNNPFPAVILATGEVVAGASVTVPNIALSSPNPAVTAGNISQGITNNIIYRFDLAVTTANATLNGVTINTTGTYAATDFTNFRCWYSADNIFTPATDVLLSTITPAVAGAQTFTSFTQAISSGTTGYIFITASAPCTAVVGNDISVNAITTADISFLSGNKTGSAFAGDLQTIIAATPNDVTVPAASVANASSSLSWVNAAGCYDEVLIVARAAAANDGVPTGDGTAYTGNLNFGSGTALGSGFVVYKGATSPQVVTGLTNGTQYFYKFFTRLGTAWSSGVEVSATPVLASALTDYFRSVASGDWATLATWESSPDSTNWIAATLLPGALASHVVVQSPDSVYLTGVRTTANLTIMSGAKFDAGANILTATVRFNLLGTAAFYQGGSLSVVPGVIRVLAPTSNYHFNGTQNGAAGAYPEFGNVFWEPAPTTNGTFSNSITTTIPFTFGLVIRGNLTINLRGASPFEIRFATGATARTHRIDGNLNIISANSTVVVQAGTSLTPAYVNVGGSVNISAGILRGMASTGKGILNLSGDINNTGGVIQTGPGSSTFSINYLGTGAQSINNTGGTLTFTTNQADTINKPSGALTLNTPITHAGSINFLSGIVNTATPNLLTMGAGSTVTGASNASYVNGPVKKIGNTPFTFPVGKANGYVPIGIDVFVGGTVADEFTAEYIRSSARALGPVTAGPGLHHVSACDYWTLDKGIATPTSVDVKGYWSANNVCGTAGSYIDDLASLTMAHFDGSGWNSYPVTPILTGGSTVTTGSITWPVVSTFSPFSLAGSTFSNPLPVIINYLTGTKNNGNHLLNWKATCVSVPSVTIDLERSTDSRNYSNIYSIFATALRCQQPFNYTDNQPAKGTNYYRLKMTSADGKITYSTVVPLINASKGIDIMNIAPNPVVNSSFDLKISSAEKAQIELVITDMQGRLLQKQSVNMIAGFNSIPMNVKNLAAGTYQLVGNTADGKTRVLRFVIQ